MTKYLTLLRGINIGGKNIIRMANLKACFESWGFNDVTTYIQSGNVIFSSDKKDVALLTAMIEAELSKSFSYNSKIVLITQAQLESVIKNAPNGFGSKPDEYRYDVLFLKNSLSSSEALQAVALRQGVDMAWAGEDVLYFSRLISRAGQSYLNKIISLPVYQQMTIRNWNTTTRLHELMT
jgi:uncharacterized protein (DUF1697 family)